jgi:lysozyme
MKLTPRIAAYIASEEGLVREAYRDSKGIWTWALGVTNASGHEVHPRYLDRPQSIERCIEISLWLMEHTYLPAVEQAFRDHELSESQVAAALSFHWNTGAILSSSWVRDWKAGKPVKARAAFMEWRKPAAIIPRRHRECDLFFDGKWPAPIVPVYPVAKPSYTPQWGRAERIDLGPIIAGILP